MWGLFGTAACRPIVPMPLIHLQRSHAPNRHESEGWNYTRNFASTFVIHGGTRFFYMPQSWGMGQILSLPLRRRHAEDFSDARKIQRLWLGLNPRTRVTEATRPLDHRSRLSETMYVTEQISHVLDKIPHTNARTLTSIPSGQFYSLYLTSFLPYLITYLLTY